MKKVVKLNESDLRNIISEAVCNILKEGSRYSYEEEQEQLQNLMEFLEEQGEDWNQWKEIALSLIGWMDNSLVVEWAEANGYLESLSDENDNEEEYQEGNVYNMANWRHDRVLDNLKPGTVVDSEVIDQLANSVPPTVYGNGIFQPGEAYGHYNGNETYMTFQQVGDGNWKYIGLCFAGQTKPVNVR